MIRKALTRSFAVRIFCALAFLGMLLLPLLKTLRPFPQTISTTHDQITNVIPLVQSAEDSRWDGTNHTAELLWNSDRPWTIESIDIMVGTYFSQPILKSAKLESDSCQFRAPWWNGLHDNVYLRLDAKNGFCELKSGEKLRLSIRTLRSPALAIMNVPLRTPSPYLSGAEERSPPIAIMSIIQGAPSNTKIQEPVSRLEFLSSLWNMLPQQYFLVILVSIFCVLLGLMMFSNGRIFVNALKITSVFLGICSYQALISPPMQGPDEATHFSSYLTFTGQESKLQAMYDLLQRTHYPRINCQVSACLSAHDASNPSTLPIPSYVRSIDISSRSALASFGLKAFGGFFQEQVVEHQLLGLRYFNILTASLLVFLSVLVFFSHRSLTDSLAHQIYTVFLIVPTFGFLIMNANNHGATISGYICLLLGCLGILKSQRAFGVAQMAWAGFLACWIFAAGRTGIAGSLILTVTFYSLFLFKTKGMRAQVIGTCALSTAIGLSGYALSGTGYFDAHLPGLQARIHNISGNFGISLFWFYLSPGLIIFFAIFATAIFPRIMHRRSRLKVDPVISFFGSKLAALSALAITAALLIWPLLHSTLAIPDIEFSNHSFTRLKFASNFLKSFWLNLGIGGQDFFVHWSLWAGFGCPDRAVPNLFIQLIKLTLLVGLGHAVAKAFWSNRSQDIKLYIFALVISTTWTIAICLMLVYNDYTPGINPHGRYFIGPTLIFTFLGLGGFFDASGKQRPSRSFFTSILLGSIGMGAGSWFWLDRFFR